MAWNSVKRFAGRFWLCLVGLLMGYSVAYVTVNHINSESVPANQSLRQLFLAADSILVAEVTGVENFGPQEEMCHRVCLQSMTMQYNIRIREVLRGDPKAVNKPRLLIAKECFHGPNEVGQRRLLVGNNYLLFLDRYSRRPVFPLSRYAVPVSQSVLLDSSRSKNREEFHIAEWVMSQNPDTPEKEIATVEVRAMIYQSEWDVLLKRQLELIPRASRTRYCEYLESELGLSAVEQACSGIGK